MTAIAGCVAAFALGYLLGIYCHKQKPPLPDLTRRQRRF